MNPKQAAIQAARRHFKNPQDRKYFLRQMGAESNFSDATSPAGAQGYAQIMPGTAAAWHVRNVHDPVEAYDKAAAHMASYLHSYGGSWAKALTAYNAGPGRVGGPLPAETRAYISRILGGKGDASSNATGGGGGLTASTHTTPASTSTDTNGALVDSLLAGGSGKVKGSIHENILSHAQALVQSGAYTTTTPAKTSVSLHQSSGGSGGAANTSAPGEHAGTTMIDGKPVANWIAAEVRWARAHGWKGRINSGYRSDAEQVRIWNSGVRPAAKPKSLGGGGSNHSGTNFPYGAIDVSDAQELARILRNKPGGSRLVWAGAKDPVHLSHPHGGGY